MKRTQINYFKIILSLTWLLLVFSCGGSGGNTSETKAAEKKSAAEKAPLKLTIGLMPAVDSAPIFLAKDRGYFSGLNLDLELILFTNAQDRQSALQSGEIDGAMTDLVALAVNTAGGFPLKATTLTDGMFPILAQKGAADKQAVKIGLMEISVSNFLIDNWLSEDYRLEKVFINSIPARLEAVASGQLDMGLFPEPIASAGAAKGLEKLIFSQVDDYCPDVIVFTGKALEKTSALKAFHRGYNMAVADIQADKNLAIESLMNNIPNLAPELGPLIDLPVYHYARLPDEAFLRKIIEWTDSITSMKIDLDPSAIIVKDYLTID